MSHRALIAAKGCSDDSGSVTLYHSQNGADQLRLYPLLDQYLQQSPDGDITDVNNIDNTGLSGVEADLEWMESSQAEAPTVAPDPIAEDLDPESFASLINFVEYEAVYGVDLPGGTDTSQRAVEVYLPVFLDVGIMPLFSRFVEFEAYPRDSLPPEFDAATDAIIEGSVSPEHSLAAADYLDAPGRPEVLELLIDSHMGLLQTIYSVSPDPDRDKLLAMVVSGNHYTVGRVDTSSSVPLPDPNGAGVLVRLPVNDFNYEQLTSLYSDWQHLANRLRVTHSLEALEGMVEAVQDGDSANFSIEAYQAGFVEDLKSEFGSAISTLSPQFGNEAFKD